MNTIKYIFTDLLGLICILVIVMFLPFPDFEIDYTWPQWYVALSFTCLVIGIVFSRGRYHGLTLGIEFVLLELTILYLIGRPAAVPASVLLKTNLILPLLPSLPVGLLFGYLGERIHLKWKTSS